MSNPSFVPNSTVSALEHALADLEAEVAALPPQPVKVVATDDDLTVSLDTDCRLIAVEFTSQTLNRGLTNVADRILQLQERAIQALSSATTAQGVEIEYAESGTMPAPLPSTMAPQLPDMPTFADIDRIEAAFEARFRQTKSLQLGESHRAESEWVTLSVDGVGKLSELRFKDSARSADPIALADDVVETAERALAKIA